MKRYISLKLIPAALAALFLVPALFAEDGTHVWYDGDVAQSITLQEDLVAEFGNSGAAKSKDSAAQIVGLNGGVRIYRVSDSGVLGNIAAGKSLGSATLSPVFTTGAGERLALPGGVIVSLDASWSASQCEAWINGKGSLAQQKLPITGNFYLISSDAGFASLDLANSLRGEAGVLSASPNWWRDLTTK